MSWTLIEAGTADSQTSRYEDSHGRVIAVDDGDFRERYADNPGEMPLWELWETFQGIGHWWRDPYNEFRQYLDVLGVSSDIRFCDRCEYPHARGVLEMEGTGTLDGLLICDECRSDYYSYCETCDGWYPDGDGDDHAHEEDEDTGNDGCFSPQTSFTIRNDGEEPLANDTRVTVTLPAGVIDETGMAEIEAYLRRYASQLRLEADTADQRARARKFQLLSYDVYEVGSTWQTREGNFTKRLSRYAYRNHSLKLEPVVLSAIGTIASDHSRPVDVDIDVTRELNNSAEYFYHEDSCWWQSYGDSRCALKTNGGFGLRSFEREGRYPAITGRAWVLPLKRRDPASPLKPTFNTMTPDAFVVFNGYGDLDGYNAARIVARLAGWTYKKIAFSCEPMYVNSDSGYLVGPEELMQATGGLSMSVPRHATLFYDEEANRIRIAELERELTEPPLITREEVAANVA